MWPGSVTARQGIRDLFNIRECNLPDTMIEVRGQPLISAIQQNIGSGIAVAIVSIPLSISVAVGSDVSPSMGCITMIWTGLICALLGGSHFNIVAPTVALSGLISSASLQYGQEVLPLLTVMAAVICMVIFLTNMDKLATFVPSSTMQGFKLAVCIIIVCNQINFALGLDNYPRLPSFVDNVIENLNHISETEWQAVVMFLSFLVGQIALTALIPRIPWSVVTVSTGIFFGYLSNVEGALSYKFRTLDSRYPGISLSIFSIPDLKPEYFEPETFYALFLNSISFAFVAVLQVVISAKYATTHPRRYTGAIDRLIAGLRTS